MNSRLDSALGRGVLALTRQLDQKIPFATDPEVLRLELAPAGVQ